MAGASYRLEIDDSEVRAMFARLAASGANMRPLFVEIGSAMEDSTRARFRTQRSPDGTPWADLSPVTLARKRTDRILYESGDLLNSIRFEADANQVQLIAGPTEYAATHQFGRADNRMYNSEDGNPAPIPARPFLGLSDADLAEVEDALSSFLDAAIGR